jgi:hypothetical protein
MIGRSLVRVAAVTGGTNREGLAGHSDDSPLSPSRETERAMTRPLRFIMAAVVLLAGLGGVVGSAAAADASVATQAEVTAEEDVNYEDESLLGLGIVEDEAEADAEANVEAEADVNVEEEDNDENEDDEPLGLSL